MVDQLKDGLSPQRIRDINGVVHTGLLIETVLSLLPDKIAALPEPRQTFCRSGFESEQGTGGLILVANMRQAIDFVNE